MIIRELGVITEYLHRFVIRARIDRISPANTRAKAWDPDTGGDETFGGIRLSPTGQEPATHTACNTAATEEMRTQVLDAQSKVPWQRLYAITDPWEFDAVFEEAGLKRIRHDAAGDDVTAEFDPEG